MSHFCLIEDSGCSTVLSPLLVSWCAKCLKVLDSRQASSEAMQFSIVLVKYGKAFTEKYVIWMEAYVALKHIYLSAYIPFIGTEASSYHQRRRLPHMVPHLFSLEDVF